VLLTGYLSVLGGGIKALVTKMLLQHS